jgi:5-methylcytosine-specific restriction endonuclease McrA
MYRGSTLFVIARKGLAAAEIELVAEREPPNERVPATAASIFRRQPANASGLGDRVCVDLDGYRVHMEDALILREAAHHLVAREDDAARESLRKLSRDDPVEPPVVDSRVAAARPERVPRPRVKPQQLADVLRRDAWRCHYCARRLVASPVIEIIGTLCPDEFPFPPGHHMPVARTHPAAIRVYPNVDHVHAGSLGGNWHAEDNLIAACTPCNEAKSDRLGWTTLEHERDEDWHGLTELYRRLTQRLPEVRTYHRDWLRALGV